MVLMVLVLLKGKEQLVGCSCYLWLHQLDSMFDLVAHCGGMEFLQCETCSEIDEA